MPRAPLPASLRIDGIGVPVRLRPRSNARRITLSVNSATLAVTLTVPPRTSLRKAQRFVEAHRNWLASRVDAAPKGIGFEEGMLLPYRGAPHRVLGVAGRAVTCTGDEIHVGRDGVPMTTRLSQWLREQARERLAARSTVHAEALGVRYTRLRITDTKSRWGSCSSQGVLSYSWRTILAPDGALDYLAAHEVSHLREMNHGPRFWALVSERCPDQAVWRTWFRQHGADLHRYGRAV